MVNCYQPHFTVFITQHGCVMWLKVSRHFPLRLPLPPRTSTPGGMKLLERKVRSSMQPGSLQFYKYVGDNSRCSVLATQLPGFSRWHSDKESTANTGEAGDKGLIPGSGRSPGGGNDNPLQYSYLENSLDRGAWQAKIQGVAKSQTQQSTAQQC